MYDQLTGTFLSMIYYILSRYFAQGFLKEIRNGLTFNKK